jgi:hypothetical protein
MNDLFGANSACNEWQRSPQKGRDFIKENLQAARNKKTLTCAASRAAPWPFSHMRSWSHAAQVSSSDRRLDKQQ